METSLVQEAASLEHISMNDLIAGADSFIRKQYLGTLSEAQVAPMSSANLYNMEVGRNVRLFRLTSLSYGTHENVSGKIANIYSALSAYRCGQVLILDSTGSEVSLYLGVTCDNAAELRMDFDIFRGSMLGNFPGVRYRMLSTTQNEELLNQIFHEPGIRVASVSALATPGETIESSAYGIERLVDGMYGKPFTMILIADSVPEDDLTLLRQNMESMYTQLYPFRDYSISSNEGECQTQTRSVNLTKSESVSEGKSVTKGETTGTSTSDSTQPHMEQERERQAKNQLIGSVVSLAIMGAGFAVGRAKGSKAALDIKDMLSGLYFGGSISNILNSAQTLTGAVPANAGDSSTQGENTSLSFSEAETSSIQKGFSSSKGISDGVTRNTGSTLQTTCQNKSIDGLLKILDRQIDRVQHVEEIGGFQCAAYFIAGDNATAMMAANMYRAFLGTGNRMGQRNAINLWKDRDSISDLSDYLRRLKHPVFRFGADSVYPVASAATLVSADELPQYISFPRKSFPGMVISEHAEFARNVPGVSLQAADALDIGSIYHMGKAERTRVGISMQNLRGHMFVTGSTGMGKSNFCYGLIDRLYENGVKCMVIEPAKGEYCQVFGGRPDVYTFGTNPNRMKLLKINPFSFPEGVHVNEHIDKLLEIFNSCWPMYAAMPAVLKEAVETAYQNCGYNLATGRTKHPGVFPDFAQLLEILPEVIRHSDFSGEVKGNYTGSLVTRVSSLTNGLYGCIFTEDEIDGRILFDENVLIDLSRVGSGETKSLIMGFLVMKLQEYRMSYSRMNMPLHHVTVLEEAHHLLKKSGGHESVEGVNPAALSIEMLTNAIAEMRTYGEGFLIADQSPSLMDSSAIRNTNTKVVFKLPESADRMAAGHSMPLNEEQLTEISRLECGVALVYQSGWEHPILAKINYYDPSSYQPFTFAPETDLLDEKALNTQTLAVLLKDRLKPSGKSSLDEERCRELVRRRSCADEKQKVLIRLLQQYLDGTLETDYKKLCRCTEQILDTAAMMKSCGAPDDERWWSEAGAYIAQYAQLSEDEVPELMEVCANIRKKDSGEMTAFYYRVSARVLAHKKET